MIIDLLISSLIRWVVISFVSYNAPAPNFVFASNTHDIAATEEGLLLSSRVRSTFSILKIAYG